MQRQNSIRGQAGRNPSNSLFSKPDSLSSSTPATLIKKPIIPSRVSSAQSVPHVSSHSLRPVADRRQAGAPPPPVPRRGDGQADSAVTARAPGPVPHEKEGKRRAAIVAEILQTEEQYCASLHTLCDVFLHPLRDQGILDKRYMIVRDVRFICQQYQIVAGRGEKNT